MLKVSEKSEEIFRGRVHFLYRYCNKATATTENFFKDELYVNVVQESLLSFPKNYFNASDKECSHPIEISEGIS